MPRLEMPGRGLFFMRGGALQIINEGFILTMTEIPLNSPKLRSFQRERLDSPKSQAFFLTFCFIKSYHLLSGFIDTFRTNCVHFLFKHLTCWYHRKQFIGRIGGADVLVVEGGGAR
jgi:hypothetical protein